MEISTKELRSRARLVLDAVERGEEVVITYRGQPRARVVRVRKEGTTASTPADQAELFGLWADRPDMEDPAQYVRDLRRPRQR